jgi:GT2 family glycosyltransferase
VIPYHDNSRGLDWILEALMPQLGKHDRVVVVDDHSSRFPALQSDVQLVRLADGDGPGNRAAARNRGWQECTTDVILFLDGDMVPGPDFIDALRHLHSRYPNCVIKAARFALTASQQTHGKAWSLREIATATRWLQRLRAQPRPDCAATQHWDWAASNAVSIARHFVQEAGGWDEGYHGWGEEDMDFAYRLHRAGLSFVFPKPQWLYAVHLDHPQPGDWLASLGRNARRFLNKFPEIYETRVAAYEACGLAVAAETSAEQHRPEQPRTLAYPRRVR